MIPRKVLLNILLISIVITFFYSILSIIIFGHGSSIEGMTPEDWAKIETMPYGEAIRYMQAHSTKLNGFQMLLHYFSSWGLFFMYLKNLFWSSMLIFTTVLITTLRVLTLLKDKNSNVKEATL